MATSRKQEKASTEPDIALLIQLLKLGSLINTPMKDGVSDPAGISQIELKVMMALAGEGALAGHDLVEIMGMPAMNVSRAIATLRERGWVAKVADMGNRRRRPVRLTAEGQARYDGLTPQLEAVAAALVGGLGAADRRSLAGISEKVIGAMADWIVARHSGIKLGG